MEWYWSVLWLTVLRVLVFLPQSNSCSFVILLVPWFCLIPVLNSESSPNRVPRHGGAEQVRLFFPHCNFSLTDLGLQRSDFVFAGAGWASSLGKQQIQFCLRGVPQISPRRRHGVFWGWHCRWFTDFWACTTQPTPRVFVGSSAGGGMGDPVCLCCLDEQVKIITSR